ncbi:MAG TPA: hypothetical protein DDW51_05585 [Cyanobacteria bacterium UBA11367]|nr:hypothetical protein [Cyanobacteria bacterium UBA11367]HBE56756.1 hypothetical protein [Cyanobacteria bacterium UBA11366]HCA94635.1 hypothetical protein [Cyanobacteria bacterium UBA9226]
MLGKDLAKYLNEAIADTNYWGESESDSPLRVTRTKRNIDNKFLLSMDNSMRKAMGDPALKDQDRVIVEKSLSEVLIPLIQAVQTEISELVFTDPIAAAPTYTAHAERFEYYAQIFNGFLGTTDPKVYYVDAANNPYTSIFIVGRCVDETVYMRGILTQT